MIELKSKINVYVIYVRNNVFNNVIYIIRDNVSTNVWDKVGNNLRDNVNNNVWVNVIDNVDNNVDNNVNYKPIKVSELNKAWKLI